ncbi:hypothetical protein DL770_009019 [Monosporascus sp. CRB-9-2]|nr:hypothetical protein DL770_009019 [Monosporascus sp. CRB-9-2]
MSYFSAFGPTIEGSVKPDISAPGGNILSTWPVGGGSYGLISGTSMATPFMASCYALVGSRGPLLGVAEIQALLQSTAMPLSVTNSDIIASTAYQGAGMMNAFNEVQPGTKITPTKLSLRDAALSQQNITIENTSQLSRLTPSRTTKLFEFNDEPNYGNTEVSESTLTLQPGESREADIKITPPKDGMLHIRQPLYSRSVETSADDTSYWVPYVEFPHDCHEAVPIGTNTSACVWGLELPRVKPFNKGESRLNIETCQWNYQEAPAIGCFVSVPPVFQRLEVVLADTTFELTLYGFNLSVRIDYKHPVNMTLFPGFLGVPTYGAIPQSGMSEYGPLPASG